MKEVRLTALLAAIAVAGLLVTWVSAPRVAVSGPLTERGRLLFPQFRDPNAAASLEVTQFDPRTATVKPFKVQNRNGRWTIPSEHDYPVDGKERLAHVAAAIVALKKDDLASDNAVDLERYGVLDPLEPTASLTGRGTRVLVRGANDELLADVIFGNRVETHPGFRYVRLPEQKRVYTSNVGDLKISTDFADWIDRDLLGIDPDDINAVNLRNYSLDRTNRRINPGETLLLQRDDERDWILKEMSPREQLNLDAVSGLLQGLATLRIVDVLPKPKGISDMLSQPVGRTTISLEDKADLARKGFYLTSVGELVSDRGEIVVRTKRGIFYTLRFGDIAPADSQRDMSKASTKTPSDSESPVAGEDRYLFIMVDFDPTAARTPGLASDGAQRVQVLRARFAPWYYIIAADSFSTLRLRRSQLLVARHGAQ